MSPHPEIGRELWVSELKPRTVVVVRKGDRAATMWVNQVLPKFVAFYAGETGAIFFAERAGENLQSITDDTGLPIQIYEYLGEV